MKRNLLALVGVAAAVVSLSACTNKPDAPVIKPTPSPKPTYSASTTPQEEKKGPKIVKTVERGSISTYNVNEFSAIKTRSSNITEENGTLKAPAGSWLYINEVDFGSRGVKALTTHAFIPEEADGSKLLVYVGGTEDGDVSNATLFATVEYNKSGTPSICRRLTNTDAIITDVHPVTFVVSGPENTAVTLKDYQFSKSAIENTKLMDCLAPDVYLDRSHKDAKDGWSGVIYYDVSINKTTLSLGGDAANTGYTFEHGVSLNSIGYLIYTIPEGAKKFIGYVGLDDSVYNSDKVEAASCTYTFTIDGEIIYKTNVMKAGMFEKIELDIPESAIGKDLRIDFGDADDGNTCDNMDICEAGFITK